MIIYLLIITIVDNFNFLVTPKTQHVLPCLMSPGSLPIFFGPLTIDSAPITALIPEVRFEVFFDGPVSHITLEERVLLLGLQMSQPCKLYKELV